jgi:hypothetical protein
LNPWPEHGDATTVRGFLGDADREVSSGRVSCKCTSIDRDTRPQEPGIASRSRAFTSGDVRLADVAAGPWSAT